LPLRLVRAGGFQPIAHPRLLNVLVLVARAAGHIQKPIQLLLLRFRLLILALEQALIQITAAILGLTKQLMLLQVQLQMGR
jgi:hypothetical protein